MPIIFSSGVTSEQVPPSNWAPLPMTWTGWDGSVWPLVGPTARNPRLGRGVKGLHMPKIDVQKSRSVLVPGADIEGYSIGERAVFWPVLFRSTDPRIWVQEHGAFFDSFHPVKTGLWTVGTGMSARSLPLRGEFDGSHVFDRDPIVSLWAMIGVELEAPRPLWRGQPLRQTFENAVGQPFIDPEDGAPPFVISNGQTFAQARVTNPGDEPAYMKHTMDGPLDLVEVGFGDAVVGVPFPIADGKRLVVDTDPASQFAVLGDLEIDEDGDTVMVDPVDVTRELGFQMFAPVPAKGDTALTLAATGAGSVTVEITPLYYRAF